MSKQSSGTRMRGDKLYEAVLRATEWLSWASAYQHNNPFVYDDDVGSAVRAIGGGFTISSGQFDSRVKLLVKDGLLQGQRAYRSPTGKLAHRDAADWVTQKKAERQVEGDSLIAQVRSVLDELPISRWDLTAHHSKGEWHVKMGDYLGVPAHEVLLLMKLARLGDRGLKDSAEQGPVLALPGDYVMRFTGVEFKMLAAAIAATSWAVAGAIDLARYEELYSKLMNADPVA